MSLYEAAWRLFERERPIASHRNLPPGIVEERLFE